MIPRYKGRQFGANQGAINEAKLDKARALQGKQVVIGGVARNVVGLKETTGEIEVQMGLKTQLYDPTWVTVVQR